MVDPRCDSIIASRMRGPVYPASSFKEARDNLARLVHERKHSGRMCPFSAPPIGINISA